MGPSDQGYSSFTCLGFDGGPGTAHVGLLPHLRFWGRALAAPPGSFGPRLFSPLLLALRWWSCGWQTLVLQPHSLLLLGRAVAAPPGSLGPWPSPIMFAPPTKYSLTKSFPLIGEADVLGRRTDFGSYMGLDQPQMKQK